MSHSQLHQSIPKLKFWRFLSHLLCGLLFAFPHPKWWRWQVFLQIPFKQKRFITCRSITKEWVKIVKLNSLLFTLNKFLPCYVFESFHLWTNQITKSFLITFWWQCSDKRVTTWNALIFKIIYYCITVVITIATRN